MEVNKWACYDFVEGYIGSWLRPENITVVHVYVTSHLMIAIYTCHAYLWIDRLYPISQITGPFARRVIPPLAEPDHSTRSSHAYRPNHSTRCALFYPTPCKSLEEQRSA